MDTYIYHYGVKGMRWGVRKKRYTSGSKVRKKSGTTNPKPHADALMNLRKKKTKQLSNDELQSVLKRVQMERQVNDIKRQDISKGQKLAEQILSRSAGAVASALLATYVTAKIVKR